MSIKEYQTEPAIASEIAQLQQIIVGDDLSPEVVKDAWQKYYRLKQDTTSEKPLEKVSLAHIREYINAIESGVLRETGNSGLSLAMLHLELDTVGSFGVGPLLEGVEPDRVEKAKAFIEAMGNVIYK